MSWVPEGSLAGFFGCVFEVWRPRGPGKAFEKVGGGRSPHLLRSAFGRGGSRRAPKSRISGSDLKNTIRTTSRARRVPRMPQTLLQRSARTLTHVVLIGRPETGRRALERPLIRVLRALGRSHLGTRKRPAKPAGSGLVPGCPMLRNSASGPEIGLPGRILARLLPGKNRSRP